MGNQGKQQNQPPLKVQLEIVATGDTLHQLNQINAKLNLLVDHAGLGDKLDELTEELRGPTDTLQAAVDANK